MKFDRSDFAHIRSSILSAIVMLAIGAGLVLVSGTLHQSAIRKLTEASGQLKEYESKLRQVRSEENEIKQKAGLFRDLQARGIVSEEKRLDWAELINDISDQRKLLDIQYEFAPQQVLDQEGGDDGYSIRSSTMRLRMKLLHEGDLINFVNDLKIQAKAQIRVRSCNVSRVSRTNMTEGEVALLIAECELEWLTILPPTKSARGTR